MSRTQGESVARVIAHLGEKAGELEKRVMEAVAGRLHVSRPINREIEAGLTVGERLADRVAAFGGSWVFISICFGLLAAWMVVNSLMLAGRAFDPYPYILLNLVLSCLAAVQAPIILMSQNRQAARDRLQATHDYEVNLKAEIEIMQLHERLEMLREQEILRLLTLQEQQMEILSRLEATLPRGG